MGPPAWILRGLLEPLGMDFRRGLFGRDRGGSHPECGRFDPSWFRRNPGRSVCDKPRPVLDLYCNDNVRQ